ncbi:hypothetical protein COOONC_01890 [Cooperia oncophora]
MSYETSHRVAERKPECDFSNKLAIYEQQLCLDWGVDNVSGNASYIKRIEQVLLSNVILFSIQTVLLFLQGQADKGFRRLTKSQPVGLKYIGIVLSVADEKVDSSGNVNELLVRAAPLTEENKPKAFVHWVSRPVSAEVRLYERL